jgi:proline iminopeptidase
MKKGYVQSGCYTLYYEVHGDGLPVILLNGGPGFSHEYLEPLQALADRYKLVFFDQRGTGDSDKADIRSYTIDANVEDVEQFAASSTWAAAPSSAIPGAACWPRRIP